MQNAMRIAMMSGKRLPYDAEVEYLISGDKKSFIDTGIITPAEFTIGYTSTQFETDQCVIGTGWWDPNDTSVAGYNLCEIRAQTSYQIEFAAGLYTDSIMTTRAFALTVGKFLDIKVGYFENNAYLYVNGSKITVKSSSSIVLKCPFTLLSYNYENSASTRVKGKAKLHYCSAKNEEGVLILDLIPVRKDGVGYMYDRVSGKLYGNAADSGAFIIGPDKTT